MSSQTKLIKDILSSYDTILENKNLVVELDMVKLGDTDYSNVKHDNDGTQNDSVNKALIDDIQSAAKSAGVTVTITTAKTGHKQKTKSGYPSRHMNGTGVDVAIINGIGSGGATSATNGSSEFRQLGNKLKDSLVSMGYTWNKETNNPKAVLWQTKTGGNHFNHLHISNNTSQSSDKFKTTTDTKISSDEKDGNGISKFIKNILSSVGLNEVKVYGKFGDDIQNRYGTYVIPKDTNTIIKSPVNGNIVSGTYNSSCVNQTVIEHEINGRIFYLEYCGISNPTVGRGSNVSKGTTLGKTDTDVLVTLYDASNRRDYIDSYTNVDVQSNTSQNKKSTKSNRYTSDGNDNGNKSKFDFSLTDNDDAGVISTLLQLPFKPFQNKKDSSGKVIEKNWVSPTAKEQPKSWFTLKSATSSKKLNEDIDRIKSLLK
jgi:hypothetical protein